MNKRKTIVGKITYYILIIILCVGVYFAYQFYKENNFNDFVRSEANRYTSKFKRDEKNKYSKHASYEIISEEYNDAMFYKTIEVEKNKPYKVTCMVKTKNIESQEEKSGVGAQISIEGTSERSIAIQGNNEWQKIEMVFNSKNRETVNIGFRLGGYLGYAKGEAWFSDFTLEEGFETEDNNWQFGCFIFKTTEVNVNGKELKLQMDNTDIADIKDTIERFETSAQTLSERKMIANCDIYEIDVPLTSLSYDNQFGYYAAPEDVEQQIENIVANNNYDHIFVIIKLRR